MKTLNFTGRLIYFDYQQHECKLDYQSTFNFNSSSSKFKHHRSYYRSTISFRHKHDVYKSSNLTQLTSMNSSKLFNDTEMNVNSCGHTINADDRYFSYAYFLSQLPKSYQLYSRSLFNAFNLILSLLNSTIIDCKTLRIRQTYSKSLISNFNDINIYTTKKLTPNLLKGKIELIGRYSSIQNEYQPCQEDKPQVLSRKQPMSSSPSRIYYVTSLFDEPFLTLRKRTALYRNFSQLNMDLKELHSHVFDFHELEGFCVDLAEKVCLILNITCKIRIVQDGGFGSLNTTTGLWNGEKFRQTFID